MHNDDSTKNTPSLKERKVVALERLAQAEERRADAAELPILRQGLIECENREISYTGGNYLRNCNDSRKKYAALYKKVSDNTKL